DEVRFDTMERQPVVEPLVRAEREVGDGLRRFVRLELDDDRAALLERDRGLRRGLARGRRAERRRRGRSRERRRRPDRRRRRSGGTAPARGGNDREHHCEGDELHATVTFLILSPTRMPFTTSWPAVTWPKFVYCLSSHDASDLQTKNCESLLTLTSPPRAIPTEPFE